MISGYAWVKHIIMPTTRASHIHTALDVYMMPIFLAHVLINTKFALRRRGIHKDRIVNCVLLMIGIVSYALVLWIR